MTKADGEVLKVLEDIKTETVNATGVPRYLLDDTSRPMTMTEARFNRKAWNTRAKEGA